MSDWEEDKKEYQLFTKKRGGKKGHKKKKWEGAEDLQLLENLYLYFSDAELAKIFGRTEKTISNVREKYGLYRNNYSPDDYKRLIRKIPCIIIKPKYMFEQDKDRIMKNIKASL